MTRTQDPDKHSPTDRRPNDALLAPSLTEIQTLLVKLLLERQKWESRKPNKAWDKHLFLLRDDVIHRAAAVRWHVLLMFQQHAGLHAGANSGDMASIFDLSDSPMYLLRGLRVLSFCLDDLTFNVASLFDYVGHLFAGVFRNKKGAGCNWDELVHECLKPGSSPYPPAVAEVVLRVQDAWLGSFLDFRHEAIHRNAIGRGGGRQHLALMPAPSLNFEAFLPNALRDRLKRLDPSLGEKPDLLAGTELIARVGLEATRDLSAAALSAYSPWRRSRLG